MLSKPDKAVLCFGKAGSLFHEPQKDGMALQILRSQLDAAAGSTVVLASHLPWLLHLLLLTEAGCVPGAASSDKAAGVDNEGSENLSATTVQHVASSGSRDSRAPDEREWEVPRSADSHSVQHERLSISMASNTTGEDDKVKLQDETAISLQPTTMEGSYIHPLLCAACSAFRLHRGCILWAVYACQGFCNGQYIPEVSDTLQGVQEDPGKASNARARQPCTFDRNLTAALGAVIQQLCTGPRVCSWLGLKADALEESHAAEQSTGSPVDVACQARLAAEVAEVCMEAVMQPDQVHARSSY